MFTGIVEALGEILEITTSGTNKSFWIKSNISQEFKVDQSISHDGVCLTVEEIGNGSHLVTAVSETLKKTSLDGWRVGGMVNLERALPFNGRIDGHFVQGHVDATGVCISRKELDGSWEYAIQYPAEFAAMLVEKGSVSLNGISLTVFDLVDNQFTVAVIPYTHSHTNISTLQPGDAVNLEFDILAKHIYRMMQLRQAN